MTRTMMPLCLLLASQAFSATFNLTTGVYSGKITQIGCHFGPVQGFDNQCFVSTEVAVSRQGSSTSCPHVAMRWWGKTADGAMAASILTDAAIAGATVELTSGSTCFEGWTTYPALTNFKLKTTP